MQFSEFKLSSELLKAIDALGYSEVLEVQEKVIPLLLGNQDVLVKSKTGSGKTASYAIPEIEKIDWDEHKPQVLVITPTRELAKQVSKDFETLGAYKRIHVVSLLGQQKISTQIQQLKNKTHVVSGTVGRVLDLIERKELDASNIRTCIIDEADECLNLGFIDDVKKILNHLPSCVMALFSATLPTSIEDLVSEYLKNPKRVELKEAKQHNTNVALYKIKTTKETKTKDLLNLINQIKPERCIIFANFRESVEDVFDELYDRGYSCCMIHGGLDQDERFLNMHDFKKGNFRFLVASDVASRGIDISDVSDIINYDCPTTGEDFIHRIGRSGRVDKKGNSYTFILDTHQKFIDRIEEELDVTFEDYAIESTKMDPILKTSNKIILKEEAIDNQKTKLFIKAGKDKKLRPNDIVGAFTQIPGIEANDIGMIEIMASQSYVEILNHKGNQVLKEMKTRLIKNRKIVVQKAK